MTDLDFQDFSCFAGVLCILSCLSYLSYHKLFFCDYYPTKKVESASLSILSQTIFVIIIQPRRLNLYLSCHKIFFVIYYLSQEGRNLSCLTTNYFCGNSQRATLAPARGYKTFFVTCHFSQGLHLALQRSQTIFVIALGKTESYLPGQRTKSLQTDL